MLSKQMKLFFAFFLILTAFLFTPLHAVESLYDTGAPADEMIAVRSADGEISELAFELDELEIEEISINGNNYSRFIVDGETAAGRTGYPELPKIVKFMLIPPQSGVDLRITGSESRIIYDITPFPIQPADPGELPSANGLDHAFDAGKFSDLNYEFAQSAGNDGFYPQEIATVGKPVIFRGYRIVSIGINPVRYNPNTNEVQIIESVDFELDFTSDKNRVNIIDDPNRSKPSRYAHKILNDLVLNPPPPPRDVPPSGGSIMYVMGDWDNIEEELEPLVEWRRRMGWTVEVVRVAQNSTNAIKEAIQEAYDEWEIPPEHVIIVGDTDGQYPRAYWDMRRGGNWPYETDHRYVELEGDDPLPEATIGRLIVNSPNMLRGIVEKTIEYESDPYIPENEDDRGWQKRAIFVAGDSRSGRSSIDVCKWTKDLCLRQGFTNIEEMYWTPQNPRPNAQQFIINGINDGVSIFMYRGWTYMSGFRFEDVNQLRNGRMQPFVMLATCNTGDYGEHVSSPLYYSERFNISPNGGAIGAVGAAGATHTAYNNLIASTTFKAFLADGIHSQGWAFMKSKVELYRQYFDRGDINHQENPGLEAWLCELYIFNLMGDPVVDLFTDTPQMLSVERPEEIHAGQTMFDVNATFEENEEPAEDVLVCLYKPEEFQIALRTDADGNASFELDPDWTQEGGIQLTLTGPNLKSVLVDYEIQDLPMYLGNGGVSIDDDDEGASAGNGDGDANHNERLEIEVALTNFGEEVPDGEISVELTPVSDHLEVIEGEANLESAPEPGEAEAVRFVVEIGGGFPHGENAAFNLTATAGDQSWESVALIPVTGAQIEIQSLEWVDEPLHPGEIAEAVITLANTGIQTIDNFTATLISMTRHIGSPEFEADYESIEPGETGEGGFSLSAHPLFLEGIPAEIAIAVESEDGIQDTAYFSFKVNRVGEDEPFGPDGYGYVCFDNTDTEWFMAPEYEWIEIDPNHDGPGTDTELSDTAEEDDESVVIDLPFDFMYYGEEFDEVTICTNGWIALGDHGEIITGRNRRIPSGMVGSAMICPFWEDLLTTNDGGVYYWYDEENHLFVVEWSNMRKLGPRGNNEPLETFQVILYDPEHHPTFTGDGDIKFQYYDITDNRSCFQEWDTPFASIGIGSVDQTTGLEYIYWGEPHPNAAPVENELAILFTTLIDFSTGAIFGSVIDPMAEEPIPGVTITTTYGFSATTDSSGCYFINDVLIDTTIEYSITAHKEFYNDSTIAGLRPEPDDTLIVNFGLLHPEFSLDLEQIDISLEQNNANDFNVPVINSGNGELTFDSRIMFVDEGLNRDARWDPFMTVDVTNTVIGVDGEDTLLVDNSHILGVTFVDSIFYVGGGGSERRDEYAAIYRYTRDGEYIDSVNLPTMDSWGLRGLAYDGAEYIYGCLDGKIYKLNKECAFVDSFVVDMRFIQDLAFDPRTAELYATYITDDIFVYDTLGNFVRMYDNPSYEGDNLRKYGLAWYPEEPDSLNLYINANYNDQDIVFGFNPQTEELVPLRHIHERDNDELKGMSIVDRWNSSVWTLVAVNDNNDGDRFTVYQLDPNTTWLSFEPGRGILQAQEQTNLHIRIESGERPLDRYWITLRFTHNADPGYYDLPISLRIVEQAGIDNLSANPTEYSLTQNYPNPFNPVTAFSYSIPEAGYVKLAVYDTMGRLVELLTEGYRKPGDYAVEFNAANLANGVYFYRLEAGERTFSRKMVLMK